MLDVATSHILQQLLTRVRPDAPHHEYYAQAIETAFDIASRFETERDAIQKDGYRSEPGKRAAIADLVTAKFAPELAHGPDKIARHAALRNESRRSAIGRPSFDAADLASGLERREVREFVRNQSDTQRIQTALEFATDKKLALAILSGPSVRLTGLTPEQYAQVHNTYLRTHHADELSEIEAIIEDTRAVTSAAELTWGKLFAASGMPEFKFHEFREGLAAKADR